MFDKAVSFTLRWEGGYVSDPSDPGGETKYGISKQAYPTLDIKNLTLDQAKAIYKEHYWDACHCDELPDGLAYSIFDTAVNCGVARAIIWLDGSKDWKDLLTARRLYYKDLVNKKPLMGKYLKGWLARVDALEKFVFSELQRSVTSQSSSEGTVQKV